MMNETTNPPDAGNHTPETMEELRENAKRALLRRIAQAATAGDDSNIHNLGAALNAVEYLS